MTKRLAHPRIALRPLKRGDPGQVYRCARDRDVALWTRNIPHPYPRAEAARFIRRQQAARRRGSRYTFAVTRSEDGALVGVVALVHLDRTHRCAEIGYFVGKQHWGNGYATDAVRQTLAFGFRKLHLHRIVAKTDSANARSRRVLENNGFRREGLCRKAHLRFGEWRDVVECAVFEEEWRARSRRGRGRRAKKGGGRMGHSSPP